MYCLMRPTTQRTFSRSINLAYIGCGLCGGLIGHFHYLRTMADYYRHFKGGKYKLLGIAKDSETLEKMVIYQALYGEGEMWVRPYDMFFGTVERDGKVMQRFTKISEKEALE